MIGFWRNRLYQLPCRSFSHHKRSTAPKGSSAKFADMKALPTTGYAIEGVELKPYAGGAKFQKNDVLLARITPCLENGKTGFVDFLNERVCKIFCVSGCLLITAVNGHHT